MSRYTHYGEEREGYDAYESRRLHEGYPYEHSYQFRHGWEDAERDERWERNRRDEEREAAEAVQMEYERRQRAVYDATLEEEFQRQFEEQPEQEQEGET